MSDWSSYDTIAARYDDVERAGAALASAWQGLTQA